MRSLNESMVRIDDDTGPAPSSVHRGIGSARTHPVVFRIRKVVEEKEQ